MSCLQQTIGRSPSKPIRWHSRKRSTSAKISTSAIGIRFRRTISFSRAHVARATAEPAVQIVRTMIPPAALLGPWFPAPRQNALDESSSRTFRSSQNGNFFRSGAMPSTVSVTPCAPSLLMRRTLAYHNTAADCSFADSRGRHRPKYLYPFEPIDPPQPSSQTPLLKPPGEPCAKTHRLGFRRGAIATVIVFWSPITAAPQVADPSHAPSAQ